jgi:uncharacterized RDD family membrane protein YckC
MNDGLDEIRSVIKSGDDERARQMLRVKLMSNPTAEIYYLASQVARNEEQRRDFIDKALALDPFHEGASNALSKLKRDENSDIPAQENPFRAEPRRQTPPSTLFPDTRQQSQSATSTHALADFGTRFIAYFIDALILFFVMTFASLFFLPPPALTPGMSDIEYLNTLTDWQNRVIIVTYIVQTAYYVYFLARNNGQTIGKRMMKIRVVKLNGQPLTLADAAIRCAIGYPASGFFFFIGFIWAAFDAKRQAWHDKLASTVVVRAE